MNRRSQDNHKCWASRWRIIANKALLWLLAAGCFYLVYRRIEGAANSAGQTAWQYLVAFFAGVDWLAWLGLMVPYSLFFLLVDSHAIWRVIRWFNAPNIRFTQILPVRASAFILSLFNEQVGKGAISFYLLKCHKVPIWQALSSMIYNGMIEIYQLLLFAAGGFILHFDFILVAAEARALVDLILVFMIMAALYLPVHLLYFSGRLLPGSRWREQPLLHGFRQSTPYQYLLLLLFKMPNMLGAVLVYTLALECFHVEVAFTQVLFSLPLIFLAAALPLPFHAGGLLLWTLLYPDLPKVGAFAFVMHLFFVSFNAVIGAFFLPWVSSALFADKKP